MLVVANSEILWCQPLPLFLFLFSTSCNQVLWPHTRSSVPSQLVSCFCPSSMQGPSPLRPGRAGVCQSSTLTIRTDSCCVHTVLILLTTLGLPCASGRLAGAFSRPEFMLRFRVLCFTLDSDGFSSNGTMMVVVVIIVLTQAPGRYTCIRPHLATLPSYVKILLFIYINL